MRFISVFAALAVSSLWLASAPLTAQTEVPRVARLGLLSDYEKFGPPASPSDWLESFRAGLRELGYIEGKNIVLEFRYANRDPEKLARMAAELAAMKVNVIVAASTTAAKAAKDATHTIPLVFWGAEPISSGLVANLDHPGENLTGVTANEEQHKQFLTQLKQLVPGLNRVAILFNRSYAPVPGLLKNAESGARALGLSSQLVEVAAPGDLPGAFEAMKREGRRAVLVLNHSMFFRERAKLATLAIENGIAVSTPYLPNAEAGALIAHEADFDQVWRINAGYVDKILKGANPGDLPVQRLAAFRYSINLKTAKALSLTIPTPILNRAAMVIADSAPANADTGQPSSAAVAYQPTDQDEATIRKIWAEYERAWNRHDAKALANFYAEDGDAIFPSGRKASGRRAVEAAETANHLSINRSSHTTREIQAIRFVSSDVALIDGSTEITGMVGTNGESLPSRQGLMTTVLVRKSGMWRIAANRAMTPTGSARAGTTNTTTTQNEGSNVAQSVEERERTPSKTHSLGPTESDTGPDAQAVLARTEELNQAFLHADMATLERIIADDCLQITQNGAGTKAEWLAPYRSGARRLESVKPPQWRRIRLYGDVAVITSAGEIVVLVEGERRPYRLFNTRTWVKRSGQWYLVLAQNTPRGADIQPPQTESGTETEAEQQNAMPSHAQTSSQPEEEIKKLEAERSKAQVQGDTGKLDELLAPEFMEVNTAGQIRTKRENIEGHKSGQAHWERFDLDELNVRVYGETAVVSGHLTRKGTFGGRELSGQSRYTRYYVQRQGHWQAIFQHSVPAIAAEKKPSDEASGQENRNPESEAQARRIIDAFNAAGNKRDMEGLRNALNFPFVRIASGNVRISRTREEFTSDAPPQWQAEGWHHSTVDSVEFIQSSADKVHAAVVFSRYKADGTRYATYRTLRIITRQDGHWGIQCSSSFAP